MYAPGSRVLIRGEEWLVRDARPVQHDVYAIHVIGLSETVRDYESTFLDSLDKVKVLDPKDVSFVVDDSEGYRKSRLFLHSLMARTPITQAGVTTRGQAAIEESEYQYLPAQRALSLVRPRLLIADGVGLGKTIEAGLMLAELIRRGRGRRILVVAMRSTLEQIQKELWARFSIPLMRLDSIGIERIRREIPRNKNPFHYYDRIIISIDTLKNDERYHRYLDGCHWDAVWIDECHNAANSTTERNQLASLLANNAHSLILTSATPHNGKAESFAALMRMLDPTKVVDPESLKREDIKHLVVRRFKTDVIQETPGFHQVNDEQISCHTTAREDDVFASLDAMVMHDIASSSKRIDKLFSVTLLKSYLSSPEALLATLRNRISRTEGTLQKAEAKGAVDTSLRQDFERLQGLAQITGQIHIRDTAKYRELLRVLKDWDCNGRSKSPRVVVFSERIDTLKALREALLQDLGCSEDAIGEFTAQLTDIDQEKIVSEFNEERSPLRILLASDVASEGVNLHHRCHHMIHYDIPWSFIRLQQRNGRIDRFGQTQKPEIRYLAILSEEHKADTRIVSRLIEKAQNIERTLGDPASALGILVAEEEEQHLVEGVAEGVPLDQLIPDFSVDFDDLFMPQSKGETIRSVARPGLYDNWLGLVKDLQGELASERARYRERMGAEDERRRHEKIEIDTVNETVTISGVEDLKARLRSLPPDVLRRGQVRLTTNVRRVLANIQHATDAGGWSAEDLLWDVHPVADWMLDRAAALFGAQSAPHIFLVNLPKGETHYLVQGLLSTRSGYPAYADWLVVTHAKENWSVRSFSGLSDPLMTEAWINPGHASNEGTDVNAEAVLEKAQAYLREVANLELTQFRARVEEEINRVDSWYREVITSQSNNSTSTGTGRTRMERLRAQREQTYQSTRADLSALLDIESRPLFRICARFQGV